MKRNLKRLVPVVILAAGVAGAALIFAFRSPVESVEPPLQPPMIRVETVEPRSWQFIVRAYGSVAPRSESDLVPQVSGSVVWVSPSLVSGGFFDEGDPLLRIDPADYELAVETAGAAVARAESEHQRAEKELARQKRLADRSVASDSRYDDAVNSELVTRAVLRESRSRLVQARRDLTRTEMNAPYRGRVRSKAVDVGQFVTRGSSLGRIYAVDFAEVRLPIADAELQYLDLPLLFRQEAPAAGAGPLVELHATFAGKPRRWQGRIVRTEGEIDPKSRMVHVVARVDDPYGIDLGEEGGEQSVEGRTPLAVGLFVEAEILGRRIPQAIVLRRSVMRDGDRVLVVDAQSQLHFRDVDVLRTERDQVVIGGGLAAGEKVCVSPIQAVVDGMKVRISGADLASSGAAELERASR